jgi:prepilin-type N-terminal cleavage/methylation domain-containing protein
LYRNRGFTLIELVMVIVILGILAATAVPKFTDLSKEARVAALEGMKGAVQSGVKLIYAKALIEGKTSGNNSITIGGTTIFLHNGYPTGHWGEGISHIVNLSSVPFLRRNNKCRIEWCGRGNKQELPSGITTTLPGRLGKIIPKGYRWEDQCGVYYINDETGNEPKIGIEISDC